MIYSNVNNSHPHIGRAVDVDVMLRIQLLWRHAAAAAEAAFDLADRWLMRCVMQYRCLWPGELTCEHATRLAAYEHQLTAFV